MVNSQLGSVAGYLRKITRRPGTVEHDDDQLLQQFIGQRDESAFALLVERYGGMVFGICRRILDDVHDAEDAFQATFVILCRKASSIRKKKSLASWLYGVAYRTAVRAKSKASRQRQREMPCEELPHPECKPEPVRGELRMVLDEELNRLPEKYRLPMILCYLQGKTNQEAANTLGWTKGTVSGRLARGRRMLRRRLIRRGVHTSPAALVAFLCGQTARASVRAPMLVGAVNAACSLPGEPSANNAVILAQGVLQTMLATKIKYLVGVVLALAAIAGGSTALVNYQSNAAVNSSKSDAAVTASGQAVSFLPTKESNDINGTWEAVSGKRGGNTADEIIGLRLTFKQGTVEIEVPGIKEKSKQGTYRLFPQKAPKRIDMQVGAKPEGLAIGIYKIEGNTMHLCLDDYEKARPSSFSSKPGTEHMYLTLKRVGSAGGKDTAGLQLEVQKLRLENELLRAKLDALLSKLNLQKAQAARNEQQALEQAQVALEQAKIAEARAKAAKIYEQKLKELELKNRQADELAKQKAKAAAERALQELQKAKKALQKVQAAKAKQSANIKLSVNNMRHIGLAFHNYHDVKKKLPANAIYDKKGNALLSWRVAILPYLNERALYEKFRLDEPWNSPHNIKLLPEMPKIYAPVAAQPKEDYSTYYQVFTGPKTMFDGAGAARFQDVRDGLSNTIMVIEAGTAVPWTKPADLVYQPNKKLPKLGGMFGGDFVVLFGDGSTRVASRKTGEDFLRRAILVSDGQFTDFDKLIPLK